MALLIVDDLFPFNASGFRKTELEYLLEHFNNSRVISTLESLSWLTHNTSRIEIETQYALENPKLAQKTIYVRTKDLEEQILKSLNFSDDSPTQSLIYCLFLNNAILVAEISEKLSIPFVFELYPGGGFLLRDSESDEKLLKVLSSPMLRGVIATMPVTRSYIEKFCRKNWIPRPRIVYLYGGILRSDSTTFSEDDFPRVTSPAKPLRVLFIAHKYSGRGFDKGLDIFVESCSDLIDQGYSIEPIVAGPWNASDIEIAEHRKYFKFIGLTPNDELHHLFRSVSISIFPTRASGLSPGSFDGFPVGAAVEAAMNGNVVVTSNPLKMKSPFRRGRDYILIKPIAKSLTHELKLLILNQRKRDIIRKRASKKFREVFDLDNQMAPRIQLLESVLSISNTIP